MSDEKTDNRDDEHEQPAPGPADHGGRGGMATRELDEHDETD